MSRKPESLGQYHDFWVAMMIRAPDNFLNIADMSPVTDQKSALIEGFKQLCEGFHFARKQIKDERISRIAEELIAMSREAYLSGDVKIGAHMLQEAEGLIWHSYRRRVKYGVEAERRAFGTNFIYADVVVSPYPYEGTFVDLGPDQVILFDLAKMWFGTYMEQEREFRYFSWVIDNESIVRRTSVQPKEDDHLVLKPLQRSSGYKRLKELGQAGDIQACVLMEKTPGIVVFRLEQRGRPRISAIQLLKNLWYKIEYGQMRYHLDDAQFITDEQYC